MKAYKCTRTGLLFPGDYMEKWGIDGLGLGLGPKPVSEALVNYYQGKPVFDAHGKNEMYPVGVCCAPLDEVEVTESEFMAKAAILSAEDPGMNLRGEIMRSRQHAHGRIEKPEDAPTEQDIEDAKMKIISRRK